MPAVPTRAAIFTSTVLATFTVHTVAYAQDPSDSEPSTPPDALVLQGDDGHSISVPRTDTPPEIDGDLSDDAWARAAAFDNLTQVNPIEGDPPTERTEVRILYDDDALYVGIRAFDSEPDKLIVSEMRRDAQLFSDDRVTIVLDTFQDRRNGYFFQMNPAGARLDALIEIRELPRFDWDGIWYGRTSINEEGWSAEFAIPFHTLAFDVDQGTWGFNVFRNVRRKNEDIQWAGARRNTPVTNMASAGEITGLEGLKQGLGIDVKPFAVGSVTHDNDTSDTDVLGDIGLDVFYRITPELNLALTYNTDFAETEVDERRINLTRFPLFFPEKRDFFLEDAGIFEFGGIRMNPLPFQSRRIGIGPGGEEIDILVGAKLTGRIKDLNLGILNVQMDRDDSPGEDNFTVARGSINVLEESTVGGIFTYGNPSVDEESFLGGFDFNYRNSNFRGNKVLTGAAFIQASHTDGLGDDTAFGARVGYPNDVVDWSLGFTRIGEDFDAKLGFVPRKGIHEYFGNWRYRWRPAGGSTRTIDVGVRPMWITDLDGNTESGDVNLNIIEITTNDGDTLQLTSDYEREVLLAPFEISDGVIIAADDYDWWRHSVEFETAPSRPWRFEGEFALGDFFDGRRTDTKGGVEWRASEHFFLGLEYEQNDIDLPAGDFITRISRARVNVFFNPDLSWTNFVQWDNVSESMGVNSRVRWIIEPGNELFFVVNQSFDVLDWRFREERTDFTTKVGWTFRF